LRHRCCLTVVDATGCQIVAKGARRLAERRVTTLLAALDPANPHDRGLVALGLDTPSPQDRWFRDLDHALEWIEAELLRERWPEVAADKVVEVGDTQLAKGLPRAELEVLQSHLAAADVEAGRVLFERGAPGDALYVITQGLIEIRVATDAPDGHSRRLLAYPGHLASRRADVGAAHRRCGVLPAQLYELRRDALLELEGRFPRPCQDHRQFNRISRRG
jgi:hypothetical protein